MNWFKNSSQEIDLRDWPGIRQFREGLSLPDGINLRRETNWILYGAPGKKALGNWVVLRHFSDELSEHYNRFSEEALGGSKYKFEDVLLKTRRIPAPMSSTDVEVKIGTIISDTFIYYFEYFVSVSAGDYIYELDVADHTLRPITYNLVEKYEISRVQPYRLEGGNVQFFSALAKFSPVKL